MIFRDTDGELSLDVGAFVRALGYSSGTKTLLFGKPSPTFFHSAAQSMGLEPSDVTMIGDDAECDIAGALKAGLDAAILVRTGKHQLDDKARYEPRPTATADGVRAMVEFVAERRD
ncbi:HAD-IA family hydrolase [Ruegeria sp. ANG-R]|uniref:HAD-IA family hydrolase n=1 Tax=Ruegeria sp. ANG-R TaxID=1577903 RepID=UPI000AEB3A25|nr:HAD-IA family hydrolase [Ruegeria sp. ANG-R]